jgi:hypothetical protein
MELAREMLRTRGWARGVNRAPGVLRQWERLGGSRRRGVGERQASFEDSKRIISERAIKKVSRPSLASWQRRASS